MKIKRLKILAVMIPLVLNAACSSSSDTPKVKKAEPQKQTSQNTDVKEKKEKVSIDLDAWDDANLPANPLGPLESIKDLDKRVEGYHLGRNLSAEQIQANKDLKKQIIRGTFDIRELSKRSLAKHWDTLSDDQKKYFVSLMTRLLEKKAIFSKEQLRGDNKYYTIKYKSETVDKKDKNKSTVVTKMNIPKRKMDLDLTYKLVKKQKGWKIFDVIVDDASLMSNYRFQFDRIIKKGGFKDLIKRMESKLDKIK